MNTDFKIELLKYLQKKIELMEKAKELRAKIKKEKQKLSYYEIEQMIKTKLQIKKFVTSAEIHRIKLIINDII